MKRSQLGMLLSMFAVFGSGIGVGALGYHLYGEKSVAASVETQPPRRNPDEWRRIYVDEMRTRLKLDDTQVVTLNAILDETKTKFHALKSRQKQEADELKDQTRAEQRAKVRAMLNPSQSAEYEIYQAERDRKMKAEQAAREQAAKAQAGKAGN